MSIDICPTPQPTSWTRFLDLPTRVKVIVAGLVAVALIAVGIAMAPDGSATASDTSPSADAVAHEAIIQSVLDTAWAEQSTSSKLTVCATANGSTGYRTVAARIAAVAEGTVTTGEVVTFLHTKC